MLKYFTDKICPFSVSLIKNSLGQMPNASSQNTGYLYFPLWCIPSMAGVSQQTLFSNVFQLCDAQTLNSPLSKLTVILSLQQEPEKEQNLSHFFHVLWQMLNVLFYSNFCKMGQVIYKGN